MLSEESAALVAAIHFVCREAGQRINDVYDDEERPLMAACALVRKHADNLGMLEAKADELDKIAEECGEGSDPFAAWETIDLWRTLAARSERQSELLEALRKIVARTYSSVRGCDLSPESVAEVCDIAQDAISRFEGREGSVE